MRARSFLTTVVLVSLAMFPLTANAKGPSKSFGSRSSNSARSFASGAAKNFKVSLPKQISNASVKFKPPVSKPPVLKPPIGKPLPKPWPQPLPKPLPGPIVKPFPKPLPGPIVKPWPKPWPKPCPGPIVKPFPKPWPKPCPGPIWRPWPRPYPYPIVTPCPIPYPQPICQPYPIVEPQPIIVPTPVVEPEPVVDVEEEELVESGAGVADEDLPTITAGQLTGLPGPGFGEQTGTVLVRVGEMALKTKVEKWDTDEIAFVAPDVQLLQSTRVTLVVELADGSTFAEVPVMLLPAPEAAPENPANAVAGS